MEATENTGPYKPLKIPRTFTLNAPREPQHGLREK